MIWALVGLLAGLVLAEALIQWRAVRVVLALIENSPPFRVECLPPDPSAEPLAVRTKDGLTLRGSLYRHSDCPPRGLIVFCNEFGANHWSAMLYCSSLFDAGFNILAFDFRNQGESDKQHGYEPLHWLTHFEVNDLHAILDHVRQHEDLRELPLGLFGVSRGGTAALYVAAMRPDVRCVAAEGGFGSKLMMLAHARRWISMTVPERLADLVPWWHVHWTIILTHWVSQFRRRCRYALLERQLPKLRSKPLFLIAGERDAYVLPDVSREICRLTEHPDALWTVPRAKHNLGRSVNKDEYDRRLVEFFGGLDRVNGSPRSVSTSGTDGGDGFRKSAAPEIRVSVPEPASTSPNDSKARPAPGKIVEPARSVGMRLMLRRRLRGWMTAGR